MSRLGILAWEVGGAQSLIPVVNALSERGHSCIICVVEPAGEKFKLNCPSATYATFAECTNIDIWLVSIGHPDRTNGMEIWKNIHATNIPSFNVLDNWKGLERFTNPTGSVIKELPDKIFVMDIPTKDALSAMGIDMMRIKVCGHPYLESIAAGDLASNEDAKKTTRLKFNLDPVRPVAILISEPIHNVPFHKLAEKSDGGKGLFSMQVNGIQLGDLVVATPQYEKFQFVLRPHHFEHDDKHPVLTILRPHQASDAEILSIADLIFGLSSMMYLQGISAGITAINVQPLLEDWRPEQSYLRNDIWMRLSNDGRFGNYGEIAASPPNFSGATAQIISEVESLVSSNNT